MNGTGFTQLILKRQPNQEWSCINNKNYRQIHGFTVALELCSQLSLSVATENSGWNLVHQLPFFAILMNNKDGLSFHQCEDHYYDFAQFLITEVNTADYTCAQHGFL